MKKIRAVVVGSGRLGGFHAQKLAAVEQVELVAVADPDPAQRDRVAGQCNTRAVADYHELLDCVDAAVIATPTCAHHAVAMDFLARGVHLLVEKPLAPSVAQADELVEAARKNRAILQVGHVERFNPALAAASPCIRGPKYIEAVRSSGYTFRSTDIGVVLDLMIHDLDLVMWMARSPVRRVDAIGLSVLGGHEDVANARLQFENGCVATLSASRVSYEPVRRMHVWAPRGFASIDFATRRTRLVQPSEAILTRRFDVDALSPAEVEHLKTHLAEIYLPAEDFEAPAVDALMLEVEDFVQSILAPRQPRVTGQQARDTIAVADQILQQIHSHAWDETSEGPVGPLAVPRPGVIPAPHFHQVLDHAPGERKAG